MHFHLPKPLHGWREFAGEVAIIVLGVMIALGAEQMVERYHWNGEAEKARAALRAEVRDDDLPQAYARLAIAPCLDTQLKELQDALDAGIDRKRFAALAHAYRPPSRTWDAEAWKAVVATGVLAHGGSQELIQWSMPYRLIVTLGPRNLAERDHRVDLRSISAAPGKLTPLESDRETVALERLRSDAQGMRDASKILLAASAQAGVPLTPQQQKQVLDELRPQWGKCVVRPEASTVDINTQSEQQFGA